MLDTTFHETRGKATVQHVLFFIFDGLHPGRLKILDQWQQACSEYRVMFE